MKDFDQLLTKHTPKPSRPLRRNFTASIVAEIKAHPEQAKTYTRLARLRSRLFTRAGMASAATGMFVLGGTAAAIALWPTPTVKQTFTQQLPSGNHIVGYDTQNCNYFGALDGSDPKHTNEKAYYEIRQGSRLTDEQLQNALQGECEENISNNAVSSIVDQLPKDLPGVLSTTALRIDAIGKNSITLSLDSHYNSAHYTTKGPLTYTHFAPKLRVYNQSTKASYTDLRPGDTIKAIMQNTSGKSSETPEAYNPQSDTDNVTILAIVKIPALTGAPSTFSSAVGVDIVRLETCASSPTGFCRAYDFSPHQQ